MNGTLWNPVALRRWARPRALCLGALLLASPLLAAATEGAAEEGRPPPPMAASSAAAVAEKGTTVVAGAPTTGAETTRPPTGSSSTSVSVAAKEAPETAASTGGPPVAPPSGTMTEAEDSPTGGTASTGGAPSLAGPSLPEVEEEATLSGVPAWAPEGIEPEEEGVGVSAGAMLLRTVLVLGVVLAVIYLTLNIGLRRLMGLNAVGARGRGALVGVVERHAVGPRHAILVIRAGDDHLVVGQSEGNMQLITRIDAAQVEAHEAARAQAAAKVPMMSPFLQKLLARRGTAVQSPEPAPPPPSVPPAA